MDNTTAKLNAEKALTKMAAPFATASRYGEKLMLEARGANEAEARRNLDSALMQIGDYEMGDVEIVDYTDDLKETAELFADAPDFSTAVHARTVVELSI